MLEHIAIGALSLTTIGAGYKWFMSHQMGKVHLYTAELLHEDLARLNEKVRAQGREIAELRAEKAGRMVPANAARKAKQISKETQARLIQQARTAELRELVGHLV